MQNTNGGVFAIDERSNSVILFQRLDSYHLNYHTFIENLENLLSVYHEWKQKVIYPESIGVAKLTDEVPQQNHLGRIRA